MTRGKDIVTFFVQGTQEFLPSKTPATKDSLNNLSESRVLKLLEQKGIKEKPLALVDGSLFVGSEYTAKRHLKQFLALLPNYVYVYFLKYNVEIAYVGSSVTDSNRIQLHAKPSHKQRNEDWIRAKSNGGIADFIGVIFPGAATQKQLRENKENFYIDCFEKCLNKYKRGVVDRSKVKLQKYNSKVLKLINLETKQAFFLPSENRFYKIRKKKASTVLQAILKGVALELQGGRWILLYASTAEIKQCTNELFIQHKNVLEQILMPELCKPDCFKLTYIGVALLAGQKEQSFYFSNLIDCLNRLRIEEGTTKHHNKKKVFKNKGWTIEKVQIPFNNMFFRAEYKKFQLFLKKVPYLHSPNCESGLLGKHLIERTNVVTTERFYFSTAQKCKNALNLHKDVKLVIASLKSQKQLGNYSLRVLTLEEFVLVVHKTNLNLETLPSPSV